MTWDRIQSMQLEIAQLHARVRRLADELFNAQCDAITAREELALAIDARDLARRVAVRLEQENHALAGGMCALCGGHIVPVHVVGEAR